MLGASHQGMLKWQSKLAPIQDKLFKYMQREIEDMDETEKWKLDEDSDLDEPQEKSDFDV